MKFLKSFLISTILGFSFANPVFSEEDGPKTIPIPEEDIIVTPTPESITPEEVIDTFPKDKIKIEDFMKNSLGLENINIQREVNSLSNTYRVTYENRTFLYEIDVFGALFSELKKYIKPNSFIEVYPQSNGQIITKVSLSFKDYLDFISKKMSEEEFATKVDVTPSPQYSVNDKDKFNPLRFHTDIVASPAYLIDPTTGPTLIFAPYLQTFLDNGFTFNARYRLPVYNITNGFDFQKNSLVFAPSFGYTTIDYGIPIPNQPLYITARAGHIYEASAHNALLSTDLQYMLLDGKFNINLSAAGTVNTLGKTELSITPFAQYYLGKYDLVFEAGGGKFINGEYGGWGRVTRQFDNTDIGFSIYRGFGAPQSGFRLNFEYNIAIGPRHGLHAGPIRFTYPRFFAGNLIAGNFTSSTLPRFKTEDFIKRLYPEYIKTHLYYWLRY